MYDWLLVNIVETFADLSNKDRASFLGQHKIIIDDPFE